MVGKDGAMHARHASLVTAALLACACGGKSTGNGPATFWVDPPTAALAAGGQQQFQARLGSAVATGVTWAVDEGATGGQVSGAGLYTAPSSVTGTVTYHVTATSQADATKSARATITVSAGGSGAGSAAAFAAKLGRPARFMFGLGNKCEIADISAQNLRPDIYDRYLVGLPGSGGDWTTWNSPSGAYVNEVGRLADSVGAVPMFTFYQMRTWGDGNLAGLTNRDFMMSYWDGARLMYQRLGTYDKVALVSLEPDFWGYVERQTSGDASLRPALVTIAPECSDLSDTVAGVGQCLVKMARRYAPKALVGFPPSEWGADSTASLVAFMNKVGVPASDFVVMQTLDRDAGCFEAATIDDCRGRSGTFYWDETNTTSPNFHEALATARAIADGLQKPLVWWQTPLGVPSATRGGTDFHYRDNRVHYIFSHVQEYVNAGGAAVVFGTGASTQTNIATDGGQYQRAIQAYLASPTPLP
jgi:hypothetical protein